MWKETNCVIYLRCATPKQMGESPPPVVILTKSKLTQKICEFFFLRLVVNKQLNDKERVAAALENPNLRQLVDECLYSSEL